MKKIFLLPLVAFTLFSCDDYLDVNHDPNNPYSENITPRQLLTAPQVSLYRPLSVNMNRLGNLYMNAWGGNVYYFASPFSQYFNLVVNNNWQTGIWDTTFLQLGNLQKIIDNPNAANFPFHVAAAKILKANYYQYLVDLYGDVPYSEAFMGTSNPNPKYDQDYDVYKGNINELNQAIALINNNISNPQNQLKPTEDVMFGGNTSMWKDFANTVKLRYLVRMSKVTNADLVAFRTAQLTSLAGATYILTDVKINPGYNAATEGGQNPFYNAFGYTNYNDTAINNGHRAIKASRFIAGKLNGTDAVTSGVVDPRRNRIFTLVSGAVSGVIQGEDKEVGKTDANFSWLGPKMYRQLSGTGSIQDGYIMTLAEAKFLQAEAAVVYPTFFSNGKMRFEEAIDASMTFYGSVVGNYKTQINTKPGMGWDATPNKIEAIQYQRWIALTNINAIETFISYNKTGFPVVPLASGANAAQFPNKPKRLYYPQSEYVGNTANVPTLTNTDIYSQSDKTPFWQ